MACSVSIQSLLFPSKFHSSTSPSSKTLYFLENSCKNENITVGKRKKIRDCRAMVQQNVHGASAAYAKEMERLSAKESLLLAMKSGWMCLMQFRDAGGFEALVTGRTTELQRIDVNERIVSLERLNPTPRPTTSPYLEGKWNFEWFGCAGSLGFLVERFPPGVGKLWKVDVVIKDLYTNIAASLKLLNSIESKLRMWCKLSVEGPARMKQEMRDGVVMIEWAEVKEESIPEQLRAAFAQASNTLQQLPVPAPIKDAVGGGFKIPVGGSAESYFMISYLDDEILIVRDAGGAPQVLTRLDPGPSPTTPHYQS